MKNSKYFLFLVLVLITFYSCTTTDYYGENTAKFPIALHGKIITSSEAVSENDIFLNGKRSFSVGIENLEWWKWLGFTNFNNSQAIVDVRYRTIEGENGNVDGFDTVKIKNLDPYEFELFSIPGYYQIFSKLVGSNEMPFTLTSFFIGKNEYCLKITGMRSLNIQKVGYDYVIGLMTLKDQIFQITNKKGELVAEFSNNDYKVYRVEQEEDIEKFLYPIAIYSLIHKLCIGRNTYPLF